MKEQNPPDCLFVDGGCEYEVEPHGMSCQPSQIQNCTPARLLDAIPSSFHPSELIEATKQINQILASIKPDSQGRGLSLLTINIPHERGLLLAWVNHGAYSDQPGVTAKDDNATVIKALGLKVKA